MATPYVLQPGEGTTLKVADAVLTFKTTAEETEGAYSIVEGVWQPNGFGPLAHIHTDQEESFYVLEGQFNFLIGEKKLSAGPGTFLVVPRGVLHAFEAAEASSRLMFIHSPPLVGFFMELEELMRRPDAGQAQIRVLMGLWGMEAPEL